MPSKGHEGNIICLAPILVHESKGYENKYKVLHYTFSTAPSRDDTVWGLSDS